MCGAYGFSVQKASEVYDRFGIMHHRTDIHPRWNIRSTQVNPVIVRNSPNRIEYMIWGYTPAWAAKSKGYFRPLINAMAETVAEKRTFAEAFKFNRCIIPATYFFEFLHKGKESLPYLFKLKHAALFGLAGLYFEVDGKRYYVIITTAANKLMKPIHHRMGAILKPEDEEKWLNPDIVEPEQLLPLLAPYPDAEMESYQVSTLANSWKNDSPEVIQPIGSLPA